MLIEQEQAASQEILQAAAAFLEPEQLQALSRCKPTISAPINGTYCASYGNCEPPLPAIRKNMTTLGKIQIALLAAGAVLIGWELQAIRKAAS